MQQAQVFDYSISAKEERLGVHDHPDNHYVNTMISKRVLNFIFTIVFFTNLMINVDHGILPACTKEVKRDLHLDNANLGLLGSLVYAGLVLGSLFAMPVFNYCNTKFVLIVCLLLNSIALIMFTVTNEYYVLVLSRICVGFFQVFFCIYFPVWVDLFADEKHKTFWLTLLLLGVPLGIILGYVATSVVVLYTDWRWTFYVQSGLLIPLAICFMFTPARYIVYQGNQYNNGNQDDVSKMTESLNFYNLSYFESNKGNIRSMRPRDNSIIGHSYQQSINNKDPESSPSFALNRTNIEDQSFNLEKKTTIDQRYANLIPTPHQLDSRADSSKMDRYYRQQPNLNKQVSDQERPHNRGEQGYYKKSGNNLNYQNLRRDRADSKVSNLTFKFRKQQQKQISKTAKMSKIILQNRRFGFCLLTSISCFWITDYFMTVLGQTKQTSFITFTICSLTGPVLGVIVGGYIFSIIGGYNSPKAYPIAVIVMFLGASCGVPLIFVTNFYAVSILLWGQFFFGGFCMPLTYFTTYSAIYLLYKSDEDTDHEMDNKKSRAGMAALQLAALMSSVFLVILFLKLRAFEKTEKTKHKKRYTQNQGGAALEYIDNDQIGPLLSHQSEESMLRQRKEIKGISTSSDDEDDDMYMDYGNENMSLKTPVSDRIKLESTSVLYSKSMYPLSLGIHDEE
eukprot:403349579